MSAAPIVRLTRSGIASGRVEGQKAAGDTGTASGANGDGGASSCVPLSSPILVGREAELARLAALATHPPAVALVEGEAGIGKSRLVDELIALCAEGRRRALVGRCHPLRDPFPLGPVVHALSELDQIPTRRLSAHVGALRPLLPELADQLPGAIDDSGDPRIDHHVVFRAARELLSHLGPTLLVLEDLHWADSGTIEFVRYLVAQLPPTLSLVVTYRSEDVDAASPLPALIARLPPSVGGARLTLPPLGANDVRRLVAAMLEVDDVSEEFAAYLHDKTSGIPFAVEELVRLFRERRALVRRRGRWLRRELGQLTVPPAVREAIMERVCALPEAAQRIVEAAAVVEIPADVDLLCAVADLEHDAGLMGIRTALRAVLLVEDEAGLLAMRHALATRAVYESVPVVVRRTLHRRAVDAMATLDEPPVVQLAHHAALGACEEQWARYAQAAAELAASRGDHEAAARYLRQVLLSPALGNSDRSRVGVALGWAAVRAVVGQSESLTLLRALVEDDTIPVPIRGEIRSLLGCLLRLSGDAASGCRELVLSLDELGTRPGLAALVMSRLAFPWVEAGHVDQHLEWLRRACATADGQPDSHVALSVHAARATTLAYLADPGAPEAVAGLPWTVMQGSDGRELAMASLELTMADLLLGRYEAARERLGDATQRARELGQVSMLDDVDSDEIHLRWARGDWHGLEVFARNHAESFAGIPNRELPGTLVAGMLALAHGRLGEAEALLRGSATIARDAGLIPALALAAGGLARIQLAQGDAEAAISEARGTLDIIRTKEIWVWAAEIAPSAVDAFAAAGLIEEARALTAHFAAGIDGRDAPLAHAALHACRAALQVASGDATAAAVSLRIATDAYETLPRPYEAAVCSERLGLALIAAGEQDTGGSALHGALSALQALGADRDVDRVRSALKRLGIAVPHRERWRGGRRGYGESLSPQQERVAMLAAEGRTNNEIAADLFLSPRTVEKHLAVAMQKLGVRTRTGLARLWQGPAQTASS